MFSTFKSKLYLGAALVVILVLIGNLGLTFYLSSISKTYGNMSLINKTSSKIKTLRANLLEILYLSRIKNLKINAAKSKKQKSAILKKYNAEILNLANRSKPIFAKIADVLIGYTEGFGKVPLKTIFGINKNSLTNFSSLSTQKTIKSLKSKYFIFKPITQRVLTYPLLLGGVMSPKYFNTQLKPIIKNLNTLNNSLTKSINKRIKFLTYVSSIALIFIIIVVILIVFYIKKYFISYLDIVSKKIKIIASGDLTSKINLKISPKSEIGQLIEYVNHLVDTLISNIKSILDATNSLSSQSEELSFSSKEFEHTIEEMRSKAKSIIESIKQMSIAINDVAKNSSSSKKEADETEKVVKLGTVAVQDVNNEMKNIVETVDETSKIIQELGSSSEKIGEIISVINDIADQTNLLALNAAIEAARAGEQGRGFAVVADEVRKLAERTTKATKEIESIVMNIQGQTYKAVKSMEKGKVDVGNGSIKVGKASESITSINVLTNKLKEMITGIATASEEQSMVAEEISKSSEAILVAQDNARSGSKQVAASSEELANLAVNLSKLIAVFKV
ncbi:MAG: methyl-accepting chemotaxis protein [bacterium]